MLQRKPIDILKDKRTRLRNEIVCIRDDESCGGRDQSKELAELRSQLSQIQREIDNAASND